MVAFLTRDRLSFVIPCSEQLTGGLTLALKIKVRFSLVAPSGEKLSGCFQ